MATETAALHRMDKPLQLKVAIIGLGYVGLPLSLQFARSGVQVLGLDIDPDKVDALNQGAQLH
jgi:UDP-N-acetyl-D-mannosaminuronate dehydrogenase